MYYRSIRLLISFFVLMGGILKAVSGQSAITDTNWESIGGMPGLNGQVYALTSDEKGNFYAAGSFKTAGGVFVNRIAKWNGRSWSALGSGTNKEITGITLDNSGNLYIVGYFDTAGGIFTNHIAKWNGSEWSALGSGLKLTNNSKPVKNITAVVTDASGNVFASGDFDTAGGVAAKGIAKWNGKVWSSLGTGFNGDGMQSYVHSLAVDHSNNLYVGGRFDTIGGIAANNIAKWDGNVWTSLGTGTDLQL